VQASPVEPKHRRDRRWGARCVLTALLALALSGPTQAQDYEASESLLATGQLIQGGKPLWDKMFLTGWPTDARHMRLCQELAGGPGEELLKGLLASKHGQLVTNSDYMLARRELRKKSGDSFETNAELLGDDLRVFRHLSGFKGSTASLEPVLFPYEQGERRLARNFNERDPRSWVWRDGKGKHTLEALGLALLAESRFAAVELRGQRTEVQSGKEVEYWGRSAEGGLFALLGLESAAAQIWELRTQLIMDGRAAEIGPKPGLARLSARRYCFPQAWTSAKEGNILKHTLADSDGGKDQSRLRSQAAVLLGASALARIVFAKDDLAGLFEQQSIRNQRIYLFHPDLREALLEVVTFAAESIRTLHIKVAGNARAHTLAKPGGAPSSTITAGDLAMYLIALEEFVQIPVSERPSPSEGRLQTEQAKARTLGTALGTFLASWINESDPGVYDRYSAEEGGRAAKTRSLASQGMVVRALVASHRVGGKPNSPQLDAARIAVKNLDAKFWNRDATAYVGMGAKRAKLGGVGAVLWGLREMGLETRDGRYLARYAQFLERLHASGWYQAPSGSQPAGLLQETEFTASK